MPPRLIPLHFTAYLETDTIVDYRRTIQNDLDGYVQSKPDANPDNYVTTLVQELAAIDKELAKRLTNR